MRPERTEPEPGQESVWDYPRPPRVEPVTKRLTVEMGGRIIADTSRGLRVLETAGPPTYYFPPEDVDEDALLAVAGTTACEWKGQASYYDVVSGDRRSERAAWCYPNPNEAYAALRDHVAFYAGRVDRCMVGGDVVTPQPGDFYGGWITPDIVGPFKGIEGSSGW